MNEEEKESIEEFRKQLRLAINIDDVTTDIRNDNAQTILNLIEKLQKENEELKFKERRMIIGKYGEVEIHDVINRTLSNDYISVKKIKDKIENLKKVKERNIKRNFDTVYKDGYFTGGIDTLQELLEGRK